MDSPAPTITWRRTKHHDETHTVCEDQRFTIRPCWGSARRYGNDQGKTRQGYWLDDRATGASRRYEIVQDAKDAAAARLHDEAALIAAGVASWKLPAPVQLSRKTPLGLYEVYGTSTDGQRLYLGLFSEVGHTPTERAQTLRTAVSAWAHQLGIPVPVEQV